MSHQATASSCPPSTPRHQVTCTHGPRVGRTWKSHVRMGQHMSEWVDTCRTYVEHTLAPARAPTTRCSLHWRAFAMPRLVHPASKTAVPSPFRSAVSKQDRGPVLHRRRAGSRVPQTAVMQNTCQTYVTNMRYIGVSVSVPFRSAYPQLRTMCPRSWHEAWRRRKRDRAASSSKGLHRSCRSGSSICAPRPWRPSPTETALHSMLHICCEYVGHMCDTCDTYVQCAIKRLACK